MHIHVCMHEGTLTHKNVDAHRRQCLDPLELELQVDLSYLLWELGTELSQDLLKNSTHPDH